MSADQDPVIIVSGLPRSGTSMLMAMLQAGGLEIVSDGERKADCDNPRGYFELEAAKNLEHDSSWMQDAVGKVVKVVSRLLEYLPQDRVYRVLFLRRNLDEVLASQTKMLQRRGHPEPSGDDDEGMRKAFAAHLDKVSVDLERSPNVQTLCLDYADVVKDPGGNAHRIAAFLGRDLDEAAMEAVVDCGLHRNHRPSPQEEG
ncbi:MAG: sulfotransferase [Candidatus Latescibacterota bacterium]|nr:sulfotransferase [Candidatus Latescibacterota bacterium]